MERVETTFLPFKLDGNFSEQASYPHHIFQDFAQFISDSFDKLIPAEGQPFVIGDYGTADGGASFPIINNCIRRFRQKFGDSIPIQVVYEDQPVNDFRPVFLRANELCKKFEKVYVTVFGTSFYQQCCPDNSLDFILSSCASHLLSRWCTWTSGQNKDEMMVIVLMGREKTISLQ